LRCHTSTAGSEKRRRGPHAHAHAQAHRTHIWRSLSRRLLFHATRPPAEPAHNPCHSDAAPAARPLPPPPPPPRPISTWQLRRHRCAEDCWLAAHGAVYDVTLLLRRHPGGDRALLKRAGGDCTEDHDFHSAAGRLMWARYRIGSLAPWPPAAGPAV
jgi:cytochrome b involved in lipid metabolism